MATRRFGLHGDTSRALPRHGILQVFVLSICTCILAALLVWATVFLSCDTRSTSARCKKQRWVHVALDSAALSNKPIHRCPIPLVDNPHKVKVVSSRFNDLYPRKLTYVKHDEPAGNLSPSSIPLFGGDQTWKERDGSFKIRRHMKVHCGFVGDSGADMDSWDTNYLKNCRFVVASGIFDAYDLPHQPSNISQYSKKLFCFIMVVNEKSLQSLAAAGHLVIEDSYQGRWAGIWRLVVLHNLPYDEPRRNGKLPKLLAHRMFPQTRYSIWIDGKMELTIDPVLILERYLWRDRNIFAIACHKHHRSVYDEAESNKRRKRYARPLIDRHMEIYREEGLEAWSVKKLPLISDVPEGAIIIREHTPLTNLFSCLWFNEVDKFTPRDQLSFGTAQRENRSDHLFLTPFQAAQDWCTMGVGSTSGLVTSSASDDQDCSAETNSEWCLVTLLSNRAEEHGHDLVFIRFRLMILLQLRLCVCVYLRIMILLQLRLCVCVYLRIMILLQLRLCVCVCVCI